MEPQLESYYFDIDENTNVEKIIELNPDTCVFDVVDILMDNKNPVNKHS